MIKSIAAHPLALALSAPLRSAWWALKGASARNPPIPARIESMLFVCLGNICRSPFGAERAKRLVEDAHVAVVRCTSAGINPSQDRQSPREACRVSAVYGVSLERHVPQALTRELMQSHDVILAMEWKQFAHLRGVYPDLRDRIFLLPLFDTESRGAYERLNIADPFGHPLSAYEQCYLRIDRALRHFIATAF